ncbi:MAG: aldehyde dehydrogenase family protein [Verrucomicrobia bacterium]|nr:aldehyde dehydrogenase family protein [Verrucomicrobiota bacterium]
MSSSADLASGSEFAALLARQRAFFASGSTRPAEFRERQLDLLRATLQRFEPAMLDAVQADLGREAREAWLGEILLVVREVELARRQLRRWMRAERRGVPWIAWPGRAEVRREPFGVAGILGPWNYPFYLTLSPLVGALAAGNCAVVKVSEFAPHCAEVMARMAAETFSPEYVTVVQGDRTVGERLLGERFDCLFFTGGTETGRQVMAAAARHLTPVTLELGGKSPCIVAADADIAVAARRIVWGKFLNAGQTCVAPDYVLVDRTVAPALIEAMRVAVADLYPAGCGRIVHRRHFDRLVALLVSGRCVCGGGYDAAQLTIAPTILTEVSPQAPVMQAEIFGPILPVLPVADLEEAIREVRSRPSPLALYLFTRDRTIQRRVREETASGGLAVNDVVLHLLASELPFGGVGASGLGTYHGRASFAAFTQQRSVLYRPTRPDFGLRYLRGGVPGPALRCLYQWLLRD